MNKKQADIVKKIYDCIEEAAPDSYEDEDWMVLVYRNRTIVGFLEWLEVEMNVLDDYQDVKKFGFLEDSLKADLYLIQKELVRRS